RRVEPTAPALAGAAAIEGVDTPAIGAWMMGRSMPSASSSAMDHSEYVPQLRSPEMRPAVNVQYSSLHGRRCAQSSALDSRSMSDRSGPCPPIPPPPLPPG